MKITQPTAEAAMSGVRYLFQNVQKRPVVAMLISSRGSTRRRTCGMPAPPRMARGLMVHA